MEIKVKRLHPDAVIPQYATDGSGCFDLVSMGVKERQKERGKPTRAVIHTGLSFEIPPGKVMLIFSRSGHGFNHDTRLSNCVGVIDSDYRGEVLVKLISDAGSGDVKIGKGQRIAQAMIVDAYQVTFTEVDELSETQRGDGGFGSTGS